MRAWGRLGEDPRICASAIPMVYQSVEYSRDSAAIRAKVWPGLYRSLRIAGTKNGGLFRFHRLWGTPDPIPAYSASCLFAVLVRDRAVLLGTCGLHEFQKLDGEKVVHAVNATVQVVLPDMHLKDG